MCVCRCVCVCACVRVHVVKCLNVDRTTYDYSLMILTFKKMRSASFRFGMVFIWKC